MKKKSAIDQLVELVENKPPEPQVIHCLNCDDLVNGSYCSACGQSVAISRYTIKGIGKEVYNQFRKVEGLAASRTMLALIATPGSFVRDYLAGKRVGFLPPFKFFFYSFVLQAFLGFVIHSVTGDDTGFLTEGSDVASQVFDLLAVVFWGVSWTVVFRQAGYNMAENVIAAVYFTAQSFIITFALRLVFGPFMSWYPTMPVVFVIVDMIAYLAYSFYFTYQVFQETGFRLVIKQLGLSLLLLAAVLSIVAVLVIAKTIAEAAVVPAR